MRIESRLTVGSSVDLWLPACGALGQYERDGQALLHVGKTGPFRVLLVDDDAMVAAGTTAMVEDLGHSVMAADSASRALDLLRTHPNVDVVITDYAMPGMTGSELAEEIKRVRPGLPVVIATGYLDAPEETGLPRLNKPYRQQDLAVLFGTLFGPLADRAGESPADLYGNEAAATHAAIS